MSPLADSFAAYVQQLTGQAPQWLPWQGGVPLPSYLRQRYEPLLASSADRTWLVLLLRQPDPPPPLQLSKQLQQLLARIQPPPAGVCLVAEQLPPYLRTRLVELGQPFVVPGRQLFWPALGSAETVQRPQRTAPQAVDVLGPVAQQLLLALLLGRLLAPITIAVAAERLGCTAASVSQAVKALEGSALVQSQTQGRERVFALLGAPAVAWERARPLLQTPVRQRLRVQQALLPPQALYWAAGETALAQYTSLAVPDELVLALASRQWRTLGAGVAHIPVPDAGTCVLELWRYPPEGTALQSAVDPLSLYLSLQGSRDERVQLALDEMLRASFGVTTP